MPNLASVQDEKITPCDTSTASKPSAHQPRGQVKNATTLAPTSTPATNQSTPNEREIGWVSCGSAAKPNAFRNPIK